MTTVLCAWWKGKYL